jgi:hypothetical protein
MQLSIYFALVMISFLASLTAFFQKPTPSYLRLFPGFLLVTIVVEGISTWMFFHGKRSNYLYNFFSAVEFLFYMYVLREIIQSVKAKKVILYVAWIYALLGIANALFIQKLASYNSVTYALGCLLIALISIYYFFELFQSMSSVSLVRMPAFWICAGLLFYYTCSFPLYSMANFMKAAIIRKNIQFIVLLLNVFLYSSFTIAFLCRIRARNSTS